MIIRAPLQSCLITSNIRIFLKFRRVLIRTFSVKCHETFSDGESWYARPSLSQTFFNTRKNLRHWTVALRIVKTLGDKTISTESLDRHSLPFWFWEFSITEKLRNTEGFLYKIIRTVWENKIDGKSWHPSFISKIFPYQIVSETQMFPLRKNSALWDKKVSMKSRDDSLPLLLSIKTFDTRILLKHRKCPPWFFLFSEAKNVRRRVLIGFPPVLFLEFFDTGIFLKHWSVPLRNFSVLWDKTILKKNRDNHPPSLSYSKNISIS